VRQRVLAVGSEHRRAISTGTQLAEARVSKPDHNPSTRRARRQPIRALVLASALVPATLAGGVAVATASTTPAPASLVAVADPAIWPAVSWPLAGDPQLERRVQAHLERMSVEEKVGQIVQADIGSVTPDDARRYHLGSILAGGNSDPGGSHRATPREWLTLADAFHRASVDPAGGRSATPIVFGIDAVHGHNNVIGATLFPHNIGLGATRNAELVRRISAATAAEVRATGMEWTFAPALSVPRDDRWGRTYEGYSEDPALVAELGRAAVEGLQGRVGTPEFLDQTRVLATAKHYLADGGTLGGKDQGDARIDEATLRDVHGAGYVTAIAAGAQTVMASFSGWNGVKLHGNRSLLEDVLRGRLGFGGFVVGDWNAHGQLPGCSNERCAAAFNAGIDMLMAPDSWRGYYDSALAQVRAGEIPMARLDEAVSRILRVKLRLGLFEQGPPSARALGGDLSRVGHPDHRALARQAVRESLVLLKNNGGVLPLDPRRTLLVAGDGADDVMKQSGGWTLSWQGTGLSREDFPGATSIWQGLREQVEAAGGRALLAADGRTRVRPDAAIVVFGENPYAEFQGDLETLDYTPDEDRDLELMQRLRRQGIPVVAVFLSGRPLWVNREINAADAFVAAWLPGSEGGGVADVLLRRADGTVAHDFHGKLGFSWPRHAMQVSVNVGDADYDPQFAFGYGLRYADDGDLPALPEASGIARRTAPVGVWFAQGVVAEGSELMIQSAAGEPRKVLGLPASDGNVRITAVDHRAQEDARRIAWSAGEAAAVAIASRVALDLDRQTNGDVMLVLELRVDEAPQLPTWLSMGCGTGCAGRIDLQPTLAALPRAQWRRVGIPLKCLRHAGTDMTRVDAPFRIEATATTVSLSSVALGTDSDVVVDCTRS
jgi:beta-glucosidase